MKDITWLLLGLLLVTVVPASGQVFGTGVIPVTEVGTNLYQNTITAVQSVANVKAQLENLLPLDVILIAEDIAADMKALGEIAREADLLAYDLTSLNRQIRDLFDLETAPTTLSDLEVRVKAMKQTIFEARTFAMKVQTLLCTVFTTVDHLTQLVGSIQAFVGQKQAMQTLVQVNTTISKTLAIQEVQNAAFQRADVVERLSKDVVVESLSKIEAQRMSGWPVRPGR